jgi:hypothetical protein
LALIGNGVRLATANPCRTLYGAGAHTVTRAEWAQPGSERNWWAGQATQGPVPQQNAIPSGERPPNCWALSPKAGGLAARNQVDGAGGLVAALAGGKAAAAALTGTGTASGALAALAGAVAALAGTSTAAGAISGSVQAAANLSGSGSISNAGLGLIVQAVAILSGSGALSGQAKGALSATAALAGAGNLTAAITGVSQIVAALVGSGGVTSADARGKGHMSCDVTVGAPVDPLSPAALAAAVWNALAADFVAAGSMGEIMNQGGALSPTQATQLLELYRLAGLDPTKPLIVTATQRTAGAEIEQEIEESAGTVTVTRQ